MKINYLFDNGYEPSVFNLKDLSDSPDEQEFILLPFTFLKLENIAIDYKALTADLELEVIGKMDIVEKDRKKGKSIEFDEENVIMISK